MTLFAFVMPGFQELLIIACVMLLLFGGRKLPELMRGMGQGITEFKRGIAFDPDDEKPGDAQS